MIGQNSITCPSSTRSLERVGISIVELLGEELESSSLRGKKCCNKIAILDTKLDRVVPGNKTVIFGGIFFIGQGKQNKNKTLSFVYTLTATLTKL